MGNYFSQLRCAFFFFLIAAILVPHTAAAHGQQVKVLQFDQIKKNILSGVDLFERMERKLGEEDIESLKKRGVRWSRNVKISLWVGKNVKGEKVGSFLLVKEKTSHGTIGLAVGFALDGTIVNILLFEYPKDEKQVLEQLIKKKEIFNRYKGKRIISSAEEGSGMIHSINRAVVKAGLLYALLNK